MTFGEAIDAYGFKKAVELVGHGRKGQMRYCEMCDCWMPFSVCEACGMDTRKAEKDKS